MIKILDVVTAKQSILKRQLAPPILPASMRESMIRIFGEALEVEAAVRQIVSDVQVRGGEAVREWTLRIDGMDIADPLVSPQEILAATKRIDPELLQALGTAAARIREFHCRQPVSSWTTNELGGTLGQRITPIERVGVYVPGGQAPLPSSLLMSVIPALAAGVPEIIVLTPPGKPEGQVADVILVAAHVAGIDQIFRIGGAQAIAAMTFGTEWFPRVDKVVGAGNIFVTVAKQQVYGLVGLDGLFGPTETIMVADDSARPDWLAADLLAQAEHDVLATAILLTPSRQLAEGVQRAVGRQLELRDRARVSSMSLQDRGGIVLTDDLGQAITLANDFAPEHLCLAVEDLERWQRQITNAGGLFLGERSFEVLGDYVAGPSHVMPTGGTARFASPLNVLDFVRITSLIELDAATARSLSSVAARIAQSEGLDAHAAAAMHRLDQDKWTSDQSIPPASDIKTRLFNPSKLVRAPVKEIRPYTPILPLDILSEQLGIPAGLIVKLDANENPYGPSPKALAAIQSGRVNHIYPDPESRHLRQALASFTAVPADLLIAGAGADELIDLILRVLIDPGDVIIDCPPTFGMYSFGVDANAGLLVSVPRSSDFSLDVPGIKRAVARHPRAKVLFVCSPNNPSGNLLSDAELKQLLDLPLLVVLDEAYIEFASQKSRIQWVLDHENLAVIRTFSKWAGLAGLRVGYGAMPDWLIRQLMKIKPPYNVNVAGQQAALASLSDHDLLMARVADIVEERERLFLELQSIPFLRPLPSQTNFILCHVAGRNAADAKQRLAEQGILVRYFDRPDLRAAIRVSVGLPAQNDRLLAALRGMV